MKKFVSMAVLAAFVVLGCNSQTTEKKSEQEAAVKPEVKQEAEQVATAGEPEHLDKQKFLDQIMDYETNPQEWIYKGELPSLIDFYADWCAPCRITSPILDELAEEYAGQIKVYKIDVDDERELAAVFGVQSIPTFLFIPKDDNPVMSAGIAQTPAETKAMFKKQIDEILLNKTN